jgi:hypothetical protein
MGCQRWLSLGAISAQPILNLFGLMDMTHMENLKFINALSAVLLELKIELNQPILKSQ